MSSSRLKCQIVKPGTGTSVINSLREEFNSMIEGAACQQPG